MRRPPAIAFGSLGTLLALGLAGCGSGGGSPAPAPRRAPLRSAALPAGWRHLVNRRAGFSIGLPPGFLARGGRGATLVRSADRALALSVAVDRSDQARALPLDRYAQGTGRHLPGYRDLRVERPERVTDVRYPTRSVTARGRFAATGVRQVVLLFAVRPDPGTTVSLAFFRSARVPAARYRAQIVGIVHSLRARPA